MKTTISVNLDDIGWSTCKQYAPLCLRCAVKRAITQGFVYATVEEPR